MDKSKDMTSRCDQSPTNNTSISLAQLKDLAEKLAAVGDELTQTHSQTSFINRHLALLIWDTLGHCACRSITIIAKEMLHV